MRMPVPIERVNMFDPFGRGDRPAPEPRRCRRRANSSGKGRGDRGAAATGSSTARCDRAAGADSSGTGAVSRRVERIRAGAPHVAPIDLAPTVRTSGAPASRALKSNRTLCQRYVSSSSSSASLVSPTRLSVTQYCSEPACCEVAVGAAAEDVELTVGREDSARVACHARAAMSDNTRRHLDDLTASCPEIDQARRAGARVRCHLHSPPRP